MYRYTKRESDGGYVIDKDYKPEVKTRYDKAKLELIVQRLGVYEDRAEEELAYHGYFSKGK